MVQTARRTQIQQQDWPALRPILYTRRPRGELAIETCDRMIDIASALFGVSSKELRERGRSSSPVARVRQIAMYVSHVALGLTMREVGDGFARDRTTVMHACHLIEDMRDDIEFDMVVARAERIACAALLERDRT